MKRCKIIFSISLLLLFSVVNIGFTQTFIDPELPDSWWEAPKLASEWGIEGFNQSPMLDEKVDKGKLPPVEERLPQDPPVIEPYGEVGEYGGTAITFDEGLGFGNSRYLTKSSAGRPSPDGHEMFPRILKDWEYSNDASELTLYLREGLKWSDGEEFTADDYIYWWKYNANNSDLSNVSPEKWTPVPLLDVTKDDKWTVTFTFASSNPRVDQFEFQHSMIPGTWGVPGPEHYMKQFHPDFVGDKAKEFADEVGLDRWDEYYARIKSESPEHPEYEYQRPSLRPYIAVERTETKIVYERNPYFPFVDTEGNQLPYIDRVEAYLVNDREMAISKAVTGEATLAARYTRASDIPMYKNNEDEENYKTLIYSQVTGSDAGLKLNLTHEDSTMREIFQDLRFRKALSYSIDRKRINNRVYFGNAVEQQTGVHPTSKYYDEELQQLYAEYDPEKAKELLDDMGMVDVTGDGYRETPDGEDFNPVLLYCQGDRTEYTPILELCQGRFREIGLNIDLKMVSRSLRDNRITANNYDMSVWMDDGVIDIKYGNAYQLGMHTAPMPGGYTGNSPWPAWINWNTTDGEEGMEPPEDIKELVEWGHQFGYSPDPDKRFEAGKKLTESHIKNLWTIGTVAMGVRPFIVSNNLHNVPDKGLWAWGLEEIDHYHPVQFYLTND